MNKKNGKHKKKKTIGEKIVACVRDNFKNQEVVRHTHVEFHETQPMLFIVVILSSIKFTRDEQIAIIKPLIDKTMVDIEKAVSVVDLKMPVIKWQLMGLFEKKSNIIVPKVNMSKVNITKIIKDVNGRS